MRRDGKHEAAEVGGNFQRLMAETFPDRANIRDSYLGGGGVYWGGWMEGESICLFGLIATKGF